MRPSRTCKRCSESHVQRWARSALASCQDSTCRRRSTRVRPISAKATWSTSNCARSYVVELLRGGSLADGQRVEDEPEGNPFKARVFARLLGSGQMPTWVLGWETISKSWGPRILGGWWGCRRRRCRRCTSRATETSRCSIHLFIVTSAAREKLEECSLADLLTDYVHFR